MVILNPFLVAIKMRRVLFII